MLQTYSIFYMYQFRRTSSRSDPISLENIDILLDWVCKEPALMTEEDVRGWEFVEQPAQMIVGEDERTPSFEDLVGVEGIENMESGDEEDNATSY